MKIRLAAELQIDSVVDGEGLRTVIWTQGCKHNCIGCHNPSTHSFDDGKLIDISEINEEIKKLEGQDGITFSGGDPFYQASECASIAKYAHSCGLNVWCYTGFTFEKLMLLMEKESGIKEFLKEIDVLVDGPFMIKKRSQSAKFVGSTNQRIIDVKKSLLANQVVLYYEDDEDEFSNFGRYNNNLYI